MNERIKELTEKLQEAADSYYNTGIELMSNFEYDKLFDELKALEQQAGITDGFTSKVGSEVSGKWAKVTHEFPCLSLDKSKDVNEISGVHKENSEICLSWKLDGSTLQLTYENGKLVLVATRGDGFVGQDITKNAPFIKGIPQTIPFPGKLVVRGEALMRYAEFDRLNTEGQFANPRNLANATITALDREVLMERHTEFYPFELVSMEWDEKDWDGELPETFDKRLLLLANFNFTPVPHTVCRTSELKNEVDVWTKLTADLPFPVDGLVMCGNDCEDTKNLAATGRHPHRRKGMAFKWADEKVKSTLRDIEWQVGRTGVLTPVAVFDEVDLVGTKVSKASLHNISYILAKDLRIGDEITVYKANMIIPQVGENLSSEGRLNNDVSVYHIPTACPCCKGKVSIHKSENEVLTANCENEKCLEKEVGRFTHFVTKHGMNIDGISENTIRALMEAGFIKEFYDFYHLDSHRNQILQMDGFGEKGVDNMLAAIEASRDCDFSHFLYACGIPNFGRGQIKLLKNYMEDRYDDLCAAYPFDNDGSYDLMGLLSSMVNGGFQFTEIDGVGDVLSKNLTDWVEQKLNNVDGFSDIEFLLAECNFHDAPKVKVLGNDSLSGKSFCITGSLENFTNRDALVSYLEQNGGKFVSGVSGKTDYLINNDITSTSGKNKKAKDLGIPIVTEKMVLDAVEKGISLPGKVDKGIARD